MSLARCRWTKMGARIWWCRPIGNYFSRRANSVAWLCSRCVRRRFARRRTSNLPGLPRTSPAQPGGAGVDAARHAALSITAAAERRWLNPFSYPRLVQPVLDRNCVACHRKTRIRHQTSDANRCKKPVCLVCEPDAALWLLRLWHGYRTTPGRFGPQPQLLALLEKGHYNVKLCEDDFRRLALWLDCSSMFYGVYEKEGGEAELRGEIARPTLE